MIKNARVEALCVLSSRVVDGGLFLLAEQILKPDEVQELVHRLGYLNLVNPWQPDHYYDLDLSVRGHATSCGTACVGATHPCARSPHR